jgi:hypothetical protein
VSIGLLAGCHTLASKGAVVGCEAADTATTIHAMDQGAEELNPVVAKVFETLGTAGFIAVKAGVTLLVLHYHAGLSTALLATVNSVTCAAAANNAVVANKLRNGDRP